MKINFTKLLLCVSFLILIFGIGAKTVHIIMPNLITSSGNIVDITSVENLLKENLYGKNTFLEFAGATLNLFEKKLVGDGQFYKDSDGVMHLRKESQSDYLLIESTKYLANQLKNRSIPFLVCQTAERSAYGDEYSKYIDGTALAYIEPLKAALDGTDAVYFDYATVFRDNGYSSKDIYFKTDIHYTTSAEFLILQNIIERLELDCGLSFKNKETVLDLNNYSIEQYPFIGNLVASVGQIYAGVDSFEYLLPNYETSMHLNNPSLSLKKSGTFEQVCMNGYRDIPNPTSRVYRVTDYLQWPSPYYTITNDLVNDNDILVIGCSMCMRTNAYLSLLCHSVTVLDPRSFGSTDYLNQALNNEYSAVIFYPSNNLIYGIGGYSSHVQSYYIEPQNDTFDLYVDVLNDGTMPWLNNTRMHIWVGDCDVGLRAFLSPEEIVAPGEKHTFVFNGLDKTLFTQTLSVQMLNEGQFYFGDNMPVIVPLLEYKYEIVSQHFENDDLLVTVKNTSSVTWKYGDQVKCGLSENGSDTGIRALMYPGTQVLPGECIEFHFENVRSKLSEASEIMMLQETVAYFPERIPVALSK